MKTQDLKWEELFRLNIKRYSQSRPKRGEFIYKYLKENKLTSTIESCLEEGAFSAKDSYFLKKKLPKIDFHISDLDPEIVKINFEKNMKSHVADAFSLPFDDKQFDITFHSGLIILFSNKEAEKIITEQIRITKKIAFIFAHNKTNFIDRTNSNFRRFFLKQKIHNFRFYSKKDLLSLTKNMKLDTQIVHHDNALVNLSMRHFPSIIPLLKITKLDKLSWLSNELILIIKT